MKVEEIIALYESWDNRWDRQLLENYKIINIIKILTNTLVNRRRGIVQKVKKSAAGDKKWSEENRYDRNQQFKTPEKSS